MTAQIDQQNTPLRPADRLLVALRDQVPSATHAATDAEDLAHFADTIVDLATADGITEHEVRQLGESLAQMPELTPHTADMVSTAIIRRAFARHGDIEQVAALIGNLTAGFLAAQARARATTDAVARLITEHLGGLAPAIAWTTGTDLRLASQHDTNELTLDLALFFDQVGMLYPHEELVRAHQEALTGVAASAVLLTNNLVIQLRVEPLRDETDTVIGTVGLAIDRSTHIRVADDRAGDEHWYRTLVETVDGVFYETDLVKQRYTFVSRRASELGGYPTATWLEEQNFWMSTIHPDDYLRIRAELTVANQPTKTHQIEYRMRTADDRWLTVQNFFSLHRTPDGGIFARGVIFDVSERHAIESALHQVEERFRAIFDHAGAGIALLDSTGDVAMVNASLETMLGYSGADLFGRALTEFSFEEDRTVGPNFFEEIISGDRESFCVEKRYRHKSGQIVWANVTVTATRERGDERFLAIAIFEDITARKNAEAQLRQQLSLTQAIISSFRGGLCALDRDGRVTFINPAAEQMLGWREEELLGIVLAERIHPAHAHDSGVQPGWDSATRRGEFLASDDATFVRRDTSTFAAGYTLAPILQDGAVNGAILGFRDLTEQRRLQGELTAVNRLLAESREQAQQHLARELHDGALQVLIGISYQLGRYLTAKPDEALLDVRYSVLDVVAQLRALLGELRPAGLEELGFAAALEGYVARLQREAGPQAPEITIDLDQEASNIPLPVARCLFRVAQEGLRNALRHAEASRLGVQLRISNEVASLTIRDDGRGFAVPSSLGALTKSKHFGLVGMAERVALAGGQLAIRSQIERGTTLFLQLPLSAGGQQNSMGQIELTSTLILHTNQTRRHS